MRLGRQPMTSDPTTIALKAKTQNEKDEMAITVVSRWKGKHEDALPLAREVAPLVKKHGATAYRLGQCYSGPDTGQLFTVVMYPDWATYGRAMHALSEDASYRRILADASKIAELQDRSVIVFQDL